MTIRIEKQDLTRALIDSAVQNGKLTPEERDLLFRLSDADLSILCAAYDDNAEGGEQFIGLGFVWHDQFSRWADLERAEVIARLDVIQRQRFERMWQDQVSHEREKRANMGRAYGYRGDFGSAKWANSRKNRDQHPKGANGGFTASQAANMSNMADMSTDADAEFLRRHGPGSKRSGPESIAEAMRRNVDRYVDDLLRESFHVNPEAGAPDSDDFEQHLADVQAANRVTGERLPGEPTEIYLSRLQSAVEAAREARKRASFNPNELHLKSKLKDDGSKR